MSCLQFLAILFSEEGKRKLDSKDDVGDNPTMAFLLDEEEGSRASVAQLCEIIIQVEIYCLLMSTVLLLSSIIYNVMSTSETKQVLCEALFISLKHFEERNNDKYHYMTGVAKFVSHEMFATAFIV